jgi:hypothetical protein
VNIPERQWTIRELRCDDQSFYPIYGESENNRSLTMTDMTFEVAGKFNKFNPPLEYLCAGNGAFRGLSTRSFELSIACV